MIYVKSFLIGLVGAIFTAVLWILVSFILPVFGRMAVDQFMGRGGTSDAVIGSGSILLAALIGFVIAAGWAFRRSRVVR
jgi:hypothetical protein